MNEEIMCHFTYRVSLRRMRRNVLSTESEFMFICFQWCCISTISTGGFAKASSSSASKSESWLLSEPVLIVTDHFPSVNRGALTSPKEACDHAFTSKTANWGWAQFAKRDAVRAPRLTLGKCSVTIKTGSDNNQLSDFEAELEEAFANPPVEIVEIQHH